MRPTIIVIAVLAGLTSAVPVNPREVEAHGLQQQSRREVDERKEPTSGTYVVPSRHVNGPGTGGKREVEERGDEQGSILSEDGPPTRRKSSTGDSPGKLPDTHVPITIDRRDTFPGASNIPSRARAGTGPSEISGRQYGVDPDDGGPYDPKGNKPPPHKRGTETGPIGGN